MKIKQGLPVCITPLSSDYNGKESKFKKKDSV
jgi:hypothetical protein